MTADHGQRKGLPLWLTRGKKAQPEVVAPVGPSVFKVKPITAVELLGDRFKEERDMYSLLDGFTMGEAPINFTIINRPDSGENEYIGVIDRPLTPRQFNQLLHANSRYKEYGLDGRDAWMDWGTLENPPGDYDAARRARHATIPGWDILMKNVAFFREFIGSTPDVNLSTLEVNNHVLPVLRWKVGKDGHRTWDFSPLTGEIYDQIREDALQRNTLIGEPYNNPQYVNPLVGLYAAAYFSPDVVENWPAREGYGEGVEQHYARHTNVMGTAQTVLQVIRHKDELFAGTFIPAVEAYVAKAEKTTVEIVKPA